MGLITWIGLHQMHCVDREMPLILGAGLDRLEPALPTRQRIDRGGAAAVDALPGGQSWREEIESYPEDERHLAIHAGHLVKANPRDEPHVAGLIPFASSMALTGTAEQIPEKIAGLAAQGVTEIVYQPAGSDIERELQAFASAVDIKV